MKEGAWDRLHGWGRTIKLLTTGPVSALVGAGLWLLMDLAWYWCGLIALGYYLTGMLICFLILVSAAFAVDDEADE